MGRAAHEPERDARAGGRRPARIASRHALTGSLRTREFRLRSGQPSQEDFDKYRFESDPSLLAEGGDIDGRRLVIVEDVVTSAGQILDSCRRLRALGARIATAVCVIDRQAGGAANLAAEAVEPRSLLTAADLREAAGR